MYMLTYSLSSTICFMTEKSLNSAESIQRCQAAPWWPWRVLQLVTPIRVCFFFEGHYVFFLIFSLSFVLLYAFIRLKKNYFCRMVMCTSALHLTTMGMRFTPSHLLLLKVSLWFRYSKNFDKNRTIHFHKRFTFMFFFLCFLFYWTLRKSWRNGKIKTYGFARFTFCPMCRYRLISSPGKSSDCFPRHARMALLIKMCMCYLLQYHLL